MPITRHFLDWSRPALPAAAEWLAARYARDGELNLGEVIVVVPGARAGRRLLEILVTLAETRPLILTPPKIITEHALPELLYEPKLPFANPLTQQLAWAAALQETPLEMRRALLPYPPAPDDAPRWLALGELLLGLHDELAKDGLDFANVLVAGERLEGFTEHARWQALTEVRERYLRQLDELKLWDRETARLEAIKRREPQTERDIILIGMVDLNQAQRQLLDLVADRVTALVVAPADAADQFDSHGCLLHEKWLAAKLPIRDEQIVRVDGPADQAEAVTRWLNSLGGRYRAEQVIVGAPDESLVPQLSRQLAQCGVPTRWVEATKLGETAPYRLLELAADLGDRQRFAELAALVRHSDVYDWLLGRIDRKLLAGDDPLTVLDKFATEQVPANIDPERLAKGDELAAIRAIHAAISELREPLAARALPLADWAARFRQLLLAVYGNRELDRNVPHDRLLMEAFNKIEAGLAALAEIPASLLPKVAAREAFVLALAPLAREPLPPPAEANVVEILGWLELPLDDAPALAVTTFNESFVPTAAGTELFLPNRLRSQLGLLHNDRRYARDAYALSVLLHGRAELRLIVGHRDVEGNPLAPSRLLFAADEDTVASRALAFFDKPPPAAPRRNLLAPAGKILASSSLAVPEPKPLAEPIAEIGVTAFKAYLACPYRFYLSHVLRLEAISDTSSELDPAAFGSLLHDVLEQFGRHPDAAQARISPKPDEIFDFLASYLDKIVGARYGKPCRPAVRVQTEQARIRLQALSRWQAGRAQSGWRIVHSEDSEKKLKVDFHVDGQPIKLAGRIDRIDFHEPSRTLAILDYKTADTAGEPGAAHRKRSGEWIDLQLPLYRHLIHGAKLPGVTIVDCKLDLGYIMIPKDVRGIGHAIAAWEAADLAAADETARAVIRGIRAGVFGPMASPPPAFSEDLAPICQDNRLGGWHAPSIGDAP